MDRQADPEALLMIDEAILDYLIYTTIKALLDNVRTSATLADGVYRLVQMVDSFLSIFRALHPGHEAPTQIRFRLRLLQFTYAFTKWQRHSSVQPMIPTTNHQGSSLSGDPKDQMSSHAKRQDFMYLQETLPLFLALSAVQNAIQESAITELWMRLAAGYMAQAYAEQVLECHNDRPDLLEEVFDWGLDVGCRAEEGSDEWLINEMFTAEDQISEVRIMELWNDIREEHMHALRPPGGTLLTAHLEAIVVDGLSTSTFKEKVREFLAGLLSAHQTPLLAQLESGAVDGLSPESTAALKERAGLV
ncbi:MAG: hypothetical protein Q9201_001363 [Fulgogasparrea decipioides]